MDASMPYAEPDINRGPELLAIMWLFTSLALVTVSSKLYTRFHVVYNTSWLDLVIFFSTILVVICSVLFTIGVLFGMGRHEHYLSPHDAVQAVKFSYIGVPFAVVAYSMPNISVAAFTSRILALSTLQRNALVSLVLVQTMAIASSCVLLFVQCSPSASLWDHATNPEHCIDATNVMRFSYFVGALTAFTDIVLGTALIFVFRAARMERRALFAVFIILILVFGAAICAIIRTSQLIQTKSNLDIAYSSTDLIITAVVEANLVIIASCISTLPPFARSLHDSVYINRDGELDARPATNRSSKSWLHLPSFAKTEVSEYVDITHETLNSKMSINSLPRNPKALALAGITNPSEHCNPKVLALTGMMDPPRTPRNVLKGKEYV